MVNVEQSPPAKLDGAGLVLLLPGCEIIAGTADTVKLRSQTGADQTFYRRTISSGTRQVPLWEPQP
jgi:hypothetical protein